MCVAKDELLTLLNHADLRNVRGVGVGIRGRGRVRVRIRVRVWVRVG